MSDILAKDKIIKTLYLTFETQQGIHAFKNYVDKQDATALSENGESFVSKLNFRASEIPGTINWENRGMSFEQRKVGLIKLVLKVVVYMIFCLITISFVTNLVFYLRTVYSFGSQCE